MDRGRSWAAVMREITQQCLDAGQKGENDLSFRRYVICALGKYAYKAAGWTRRPSDPVEGLK